MASDGHHDFPWPTTADHPSGNRRRWAALAAMGLGLVALYLVLRQPLVELLVRRLLPEGLTGLEAAILVGSGPVVVWAVILVHELGHVGAGLLAGFKFQLLVAGPLRLDRRASTLSIRSNWNVGLAPGFAVMVPARSTGIRRGMMLTVAGGPVTSLLLGGLALWLALLFPPVLPPVEALLGLFGAASIAVGLVTLIPIGTVHPSDGARLALLARDDARAGRELALLLLSALSIHGVRPRDWPEAQVAAAVAPDDHSTARCQALLSAARYHWDAGQLNAAGRHLARAVQMRHGAAFHDRLAQEAAAFAFAGLRDPALGRAWLAASPVGKRTTMAGLLAHAAATNASLGPVLEEMKTGLETGAAMLYRDQLVKLHRNGSTHSTLES